MGWNKACAVFEYTVIGAYDLGVLTKELLSVLMEPYRGSDIDPGGSQGLRSKDGKSVEQITVETWGGEWPADHIVPHGPPEKGWKENEAADEQFEAFETVTTYFDWR